MSDRQHEMDPQIKVTTIFIDDPEYRVFVRDGNCWREFISFKESEIETVLSTKAFEQYPAVQKRFEAIEELLAKSKADVRYLRGLNSS